MKIAVLTSGILPVPAVQGGAVENLIDFYLEYNECHRMHDITVYSIYNDAVRNHPALDSEVNHYKYVRTGGIVAKLMKRLYHLMNRDEYYHYTIEYFFSQAVKDIVRVGYDMVILENRPGYALRLKEKTNAKLILHLHNDLLNNTTKHCLEIYDSLSGIICVSDYISARVKSINACDTKAVTVHNGIDTMAFCQNTNSGINREKLGLLKNDFVLIFSGRIIREKGISELIDAMIKLKSYDNIKLLILGSSFYGNADNENSFAAQLRVKAAQIREKIIFTGFIPYTEVPLYLILSDAAILPSIWEEPFGLTILEAFAAGLPVITTDMGGIPEITGTNTAIVLPVEETLSVKLAEAIEYLYNNPDRRMSMGRHAKESSNKFTKGIYADNFFKAIEGF